jgi:hypothetical protein
MSKIKTQVPKFWAVSAVLCLHFAAWAQSSPSEVPNTPVPQTQPQPIQIQSPPVDLKSLPSNILQDQKPFG